MSYLLCCSISYERYIRVNYFDILESERVNDTESWKIFNSREK